MIKRVIDIVGAVLALVVLSPLMVPAALLIKLDSPATPFGHVEDRPRRSEPDQERGEKDGQQDPAGSSR